MNAKSTPSKALNIVLWIVQLILASSLIWAAGVKWFMPAAALGAMWPWTAQVPGALVKGTGALDLLAGLGLILPGLLNIRPRLTTLAATGIVILMICAGAFHIARGEANLIGVNVVIAGMAGFVAWGRWSGN